MTRYGDYAQLLKALCINPIPGVPEPLLSFSALSGLIPPGRYDWALLTECRDTDGTIIGAFRKDGDIDDECGINVGLNPAAGLFPVLFGPEPLDLLDADPGGSPPGRGPGEEGTTRPWCFTVNPGVGFPDVGERGQRFSRRLRPIDKGPAVSVDLQNGRIRHSGVGVQIEYGGTFPTGDDP